jgi:hypothetical protein
MGVWYRVFGRSVVAPPPQAVLAHLSSRVAARFDPDAYDWFRAEIQLDGAVLELERYRSDEQGIRGELNSWAAFVEAGPPHRLQQFLMERIIQTAQLFTLESPRDEAAERLCDELCANLARCTDGVWQADGRGIFAADGTLLLPEE